MRVVSCLLMIALLLPLAAADQDVTLGPATVKTVNVQNGTCESGSTGNVMHGASARVQLTQHEAVFADASSSCYSTAWSDHDGNYWNETTRTLGVYAGRQTDNAWGPFVAVSWFDQRQESTWSNTHWCGSQVYASGPVVFLGCWPEGGAPPMLPALP